MDAFPSRESDGVPMAKIQRFVKEQNQQEFFSLPHECVVFGSLVIPGIHNSMIFRANKECPYKSSWIL